MKKITASLLIIAVLIGASASQAAPTNEFPHIVPFELGDTEFAAGDHIAITEVRGTAAAFSANQTYVVTGTYTLGSREQAELALFVTVPNSGRTRVDPRQTVKITKGTGTFRLVHTMPQGYPHISFYPVPSGDSFGGVYFGKGESVLRNKGWSSLAEHSVPSGANEAIIKYLGSPVPPPPGLDPAYSVEGLQRTVADVAQKSGLIIRSIVIDDSEFPFLLGVISSGDFTRFSEALKKIDGYDYTGSVGNEKTHHAFNIIPWPVFPPESSERIGRRLTVRYQMLYDRISRQ